MPFEADIDYKSVSNEQLMQYMALGQETAFNEIYSRFSTRIYWFFYQRINQNGVRAEDLTQDLFLKLIEKSDSFKKNKCFKAWIYTIAYNMCKNEYRRINIKERHLRLRDIDISRLINRDVANLGKVYDHDLFSKRLRIELNKLCQKYSTTFILRHEHGLPIKAIAEIMSCPEGTVKSRLFFAIKKLSSNLKTFKSIKL